MVEWTHYVDHVLADGSSMIGFVLMIIDVGVKIGDSLLCGLADWQLLCYYTFAAVAGPGQRPVHWAVLLPANYSPCLMGAVALLAKQDRHTCLVSSKLRLGLSYAAQQKGLGISSAFVCCMCDVLFMEESGTALTTGLQHLG